MPPRKRYSTAKANAEKEAAALFKSEKRPTRATPPVISSHPLTEPIVEESTAGALSVSPSKRPRVISEDEGNISPEIPVMMKSPTRTSHHLPRVTRSASSPSPVPVPSPAHSDRQLRSSSRKDDVITPTALSKTSSDVQMETAKAKSTSTVPTQHETNATVNTAPVDSSPNGSPAVSKSASHSSSSPSPPPPPSPTPTPPPPTAAVPISSRNHRAFLGDETDVNVGETWMSHHIEDVPIELSPYCRSDEMEVQVVKLGIDAAKVARLVEQATRTQQPVKLFHTRFMYGGIQWYWWWGVTPQQQYCVRIVPVDSSTDQELWLYGECGFAPVMPVTQDSKTYRPFGLRWPCHRTPGTFMQLHRWARNTVEPYYQPYRLGDYVYFVIRLHSLYVLTSQQHDALVQSGVLFV